MALSPSSTKTKPTIVVVNGSCDECYWVCRYLTLSNLWTVRATVRNIESDKAIRLKKDCNGIELIQASNFDSHALQKAVEGAYGVYVTSIYDVNAKKFDTTNAQESKQLDAVLAAIQPHKATLQHVVYQSMAKFEESPEKLGLPIPVHYATKYKYESKFADFPLTIVRQPTYMRLMRFGLTKKKTRLSLPSEGNAKACFIAEEDMGKIVAAIFSKPKQHVGGSVVAVSEVTQFHDLAQRAHRYLAKHGVEFSPIYTKQSRLYNIIFDYIFCFFMPACRYISQINKNLMARNEYDIHERDKTDCAGMIAPLKLTRVEEYLHDWYEL